jgi:hypothetical protein
MYHILKTRQPPDCQLRETFCGVQVVFIRSRQQQTTHVQSVGNSWVLWIS